MKKLLCLLTVLVLALAIYGAAAAEEKTEVPGGLEQAWNAVSALLFDTGNVTLKGKAELALDGQWFKTVEVHYVQDGDKAFRQLLLTSPKMDGTERQNGYTILTEGEKLNLIEVYHPDVYRTGYGPVRKSLIRSTPQVRALQQMVSSLVPTADVLLGEGGNVESTADEIRIKLNQEVSPLFNAGLSMAFQLVAGRYSGMDYDRMGPRDAVKIEDFATITEGIVYTTSAVGMQEAEVTVTLEGGEVKKAEGRMDLKLFKGPESDARILGITFSAEVSDRGTSQVKPFDPADYNVVPALDVPTEEEIIRFESDSPEILRQQQEARELWSLAGFGKECESLTNCFTYLDEFDRVHTDFYTEDYQTVFSGFTDVYGDVLGMHHVENNWQNMPEEDFHYNEPYPDSAKEKEIRESVWAFISDVNAKCLEGIEDIRMNWWYEKNGEIYAEFTENPLSQEGKGFLITLRVEPEWRVEYFSCVSNG